MEIEELVANITIPDPNFACKLCLNALHASDFLIDHPLDLLFNGFLFLGTWCLLAFLCNNTQTCSNFGRWLISNIHFLRLHIDGLVVVGYFQGAASEDRTIRASTHLGVLVMAHLERLISSHVDRLLYRVAALWHILFVDRVLSLVLNVHGPFSIDRFNWI